MRKHVNNNDVALEVLKRFYVTRKKVWKIEVRWWNIGVSHAPWCMNIIETITVDDRAWKLDWKPYVWHPVNKEKISALLKGAS